MIESVVWMRRSYSSRPSPNPGEVRSPTKPAAWSVSIRRTVGNRGGVAWLATGASGRPAGRARAPVGSATRRADREDWPRHARRCIRSNRSGISPRCSVSSGFYWVAVCGRKLKGARRASLQMTSFYQRISPTAQSRNMDVDPIFPPIERGRIVTKLIPLLGHQRIGKLLHVFCDEIVFIQQNEGFEELDEFFDSLQAAFRFHQRRFLERQRRHDPLNRFHNRPLRWSRHPVIPRLGN